ncbi:MAG TPA: PIN domain-containing protein [Marmoricola sp.]|nr:PIN domain-containing protein [Marmoricola sp.]
MTITAFDADVLIYAADESHPHRSPVVAHLIDPTTRAIGSLLLLAEVLTKPVQEDPRSSKVAELREILGRVSLQPLDEHTANLAVQLGAVYRLRAADATHLATAVAADADQFLTNNRKDFPKTIAEIDVIYPEDLVN